MSGQHCENYDVKRETVHCYPRNVDRCCWNLSALFKICFRFVLLHNKSLNDWSLGEQWILFPENLNVSRDEVEGNIEILGKQISLFPSCLYSTRHFSNIVTSFYVAYDWIKSLLIALRHFPVLSGAETFHCGSIRRLRVVPLSLSPSCVTQ